MNDYNKAIQMESNFPQAFHHRAWSRLATGDTVSAITDLIKAIELDPEPAIYYDDLGLMYFVSKNYKEALKNFSKAIKLDAKMALAYLHRGQLKVDMGKTKPSCKDFETASELGNNEAKELLELHCPSEEKEKKKEKEEQDKE